MTCRTPRCRNLTHKHHHSPYCPKCRGKRFKAAHPAAYAYSHLKARAKERGHSFTLTKEKFAELWNGGLSANHGKTAFSLCVDRIQESEGYSDTNVRLLTLSENSRRRYVPYFRDQEREAEEITKTRAEIQKAYFSEAPPPMSCLRLTLEPSVK